MDIKLQIGKMMREEISLKVNYKWLLLFFGIVVAICVTALWAKDNYIPGWVKWQEKEIDIETGIKEKYEGAETESGIIKLFLSGKKLRICNENGTLIFETDRDIKAQDAVVADIDGDDIPEIVTVVWKKGLYGKHRPFWVLTDEKNYSQHVFIYRFDMNGKVVPMWFASETGLKISEIRTHDRNSQIIQIEDMNGDITNWLWNSWGLKML